MVGWGDEAGQWAGRWNLGVDFSNGSKRVVAVRVGGDLNSEIKYGLRWVGPIRLTDESRRLLGQWARAALDLEGGYVHLFPADGDAIDELRTEAANDAQIVADILKGLRPVDAARSSPERNGLYLGGK